jgi:hypothetical protein
MEALEKSISTKFLDFLADTKCIPILQTWLKEALRGKLLAATPSRYSDNRFLHSFQTGPTPIPKRLGRTLLSAALDPY